MRKLSGNLFTRKIGNKMILVGIIDSPNASNIPNEAMHVFVGTEYDDGTFTLQTAENPRRLQGRG